MHPQPFQVRGYPRGGLRTPQTAERNQPEAESFGGFAGVEELRRLRQLSGENWYIAGISTT